MKKVLLAIVMATSLAGSIAMSEDTAQIRVVRSGGQPTVSAVPDYFTGAARVDNRYRAEAPGRISGSYVTFEPGARTAWHSHPAGQWIHVTAGKIRCQEINGPVEEVLPGDSVWFPPNVKHWHGAAPDTAGTHLTMSEPIQDQGVTWFEKTSEEEYGLFPAREGHTSTMLEIVKAGAQPFVPVASEHVSGAVRTKWLFPARDGTRGFAASILFDPAGGTKPQTHALGQSLIVTMGRGVIQQEGGNAISLHQGDIVWIPANLSHSYGAAPDDMFAVHAFSETLPGVTPTGWADTVGDSHDAPVTNATNSKTLLEKQKKISLITAFTANGDLERLKGVLVEALEAGLTVNEIKEIIAHVYAYTGFPRSLNATLAFADVIEERQAKGIQDEEGREASPVNFEKSRFETGADMLAFLRKQTGPAPIPRYERFSPIMNVLLKEHLWADLFARDNLDYLSRELGTVGALVNLPGTNAQLQSHIGLAMNQGATADQMRDLFVSMSRYIGKERSDNALSIFASVMEIRK